jgi:hypothetical protein
MIKWLSLTDAQRKTSLEQAAIKTNLREHAIEKDWWVTLTLKALFSCKYKDSFTFKGGTSLSKCWNLIERLSEDIDLVLDSNVYGIYFETPTTQERKKLRKGGCLFTRTNLKVELENTLIEIGVPKGMTEVQIIEMTPGSSDDDPQILKLVYPSLYPPPGYLKEGVKIEVSVRSKGEPRENAKVQSILSTVTDAEVLEEEPFELLAISPTRTFLEKIFLLHEEFQKAELPNDKAYRMSRHLYDIYILSRTHIKEEALKNDQLYNSIVQHRSVFTKQSGVEYSTHEKHSVTFIPPATIMEAYHQDYRVMREEMIHGQSPEFNELISQLLDLLTEIRNQAPEKIPAESYRALQGNYVRWWNDDKEKSEGKVFARAQLTHEVDNRFEIKVYTYINYSEGPNHGQPYSEDNIEIWIGKMVLDNLQSGTIVWNQVLPQNNGKGIKRITFPSKHAGVSLVGEKDFGVENFTDKE